MKIHFNYIFYFIECILLLFINNVYGKNDKTLGDQYYLIYINNTIGEVDIYNNSKIQKRQESYSYVESLIDEIHSLIIDNKNTYQYPKKLDEIEENSKLKRRNEELVFSNFDTSDLVYPIFSVNNYLVLYAYLNEKLAGIIKSNKNVNSCVPDSAISTFHSNSDVYNIDIDNILRENHWKNVTVQEEAPNHLSAISQRQYNNVTAYDTNYYYPSTAGKDTNIVILDSDFSFIRDFDNDKGRTVTCEAFIYRESNDIGKGVDCVRQKNFEGNHGKIVAYIAGGFENGVAKLNRS